jgi:hypothetical protein
MNRCDLTYLAFKSLLAWLFLSVLVWYCQSWLGEWLLPLIKGVIMMMTHDISPALKVVLSKSDYSIELSAWVLRQIYLNASQYIPPGTDLNSSVHLLHALVPLIIELSILLVWPVKHWSQRFQLIGMGLLIAIAVIAGTLPAQILGILEMSFQNVAVTGENPRAVPWFVEWMVFCEMGGSWLLGIVSAMLCIKLQYKIALSIK